MAISIATWNIEGRLSKYNGGKRRGTPKDILEEIKNLNADIIILPEAYLDKPDEGVDSALKELGYSWHDAKYNDTLHDADVARWGHPFMRVLYRIPVKNVTTKRWGNIRTLPVMTVEDPETGESACIIPTHLDDITEERRLQQVDAIVEYIAHLDMPVIMLGDFNALWRRGWRRLLASAFIRWVARHVPFSDMRSVFVRSSFMAEGEVLNRLNRQALLYESDLHYRSTVTLKRRETPYVPSIPLMQIDHILVSAGIAISSPVVGRDGGSDHRSLRAVLEISTGQNRLSAL